MWRYWKLDVDLFLNSHILLYLLNKFQFPALGVSQSPKTHMYRLLLITRSWIMLLLSRDAGEAEEISWSFTDLSSENAKLRTKSIANMTLLLTF